MSDDIAGPVQGLVFTHAQATNLVAEQVRKLAAYLAERPADDVTLTGPAYTHWKHRFLMQLGIAFGNLQMANAVGLVAVDQFQKLKTEIMGYTLYAAAPVETGSDGP